MLVKEIMYLKLHTIVVIVDKELMVLPNLDHIIIKDYQKDKKQSQDHMEEFNVLVALNQESSEHSYYNK